MKALNTHPKQAKTPTAMLLSKPQLSVVIIALNAATSLRACLESARFADEIVLVDSGSTDATVALAEEYGAHVVQQAWLGFGRQKQFAVEQAAHDWVLCLDADERVTTELRSNIEAAVHAPQQSAYRFARCNRFLGRYLRYGEGYPDWSLRLFDRRRAHWSDDAVHEKVLLNGGAGRVGILHGDLLHDSADTLNAYLGKQNRYTTLAAEAVFKAGKRGSAKQVLFSPLIRFLKFYLLRRGFLDGLPGFIHILIGCFNSFSKYAKLIELQNREIP
jgi:glycosyltransferase involved in cell wall biosynthesis